MTPGGIDRKILAQHVAMLADRSRPAESAALADAREYVAAALEAAGWSVREHPFVARSAMGVDMEGVNQIATREDPAVASGSSRPRFCLGAHLDTREDTPGADDNASGVAALLEIARNLPRLPHAEANADIELVMFDLEEWGMLGGAEHARLSRQIGVDLRGMVALEMIAYCDPTPGCQKLPKLLQGVYPDTGDFIAVVGNHVSTELIERFRMALASVPELPVETLQVPQNGELLQASRLSDHSPFWDAGYSALMITDTSFLRNPHYHMASDTPDTLDYAFLTQVTEGVLRAVQDIQLRGL